MMEHGSSDWIHGDELSFLNSEMNETKEIKFHLSERKGATTWYGGDPENGLIFKLPLNIIDKIYTATADSDKIIK